MASDIKEQKAVIAVEELLPPKINILPLAGRPIYPGIFTPLLIDDADDIRTVEDAYSDSGFIGLSLVKNDAEEISGSDIHKIGSVARIIKKINLPDGGLNILVSTLKRFKIRKIVHKQKPIIAAVQYLEDEESGDTLEVKALLRGLISEMKELSENNPLFSEEMRLNLVNIDHPGKIADFIISILNIPKEEQQKILEILNIRERMEQVLIHIKKEKELLEIQRKIQNDLNNRVEKNQREYFLREELKSIKEELGLTSDPKIADEDKFRKLIDSFQFEGEVKETVESEFAKFSLAEPGSPEYIVGRNYLETILTLPWNNPEKEVYDITKAQHILDHEHYGMEDVKKRIVEYLAVRKLKGDSKGSIILLVGPPGVGKTSVGKSIAHAMNKPFFRFSVGGMRDEAEIKGHRRTYIGAMPGKILQGLKIVKTKAPVFMIDEVDKMGESRQGDPSSALLEVLDPEQNIEFRDHYLDLPFDLSNIVFVLTANTLDSIPRPLLDRAEIIRLSGYIDTEKVEIAKNYLIPKSLQKNGLQKTQVKYSKQALLYIANAYAREAGVRNFEKNLDKIHRKLAVELVTGIRTESELFVPKQQDIEKMLGQPVFRDDDIKQAKTYGTALGLAWTAMGGEVLLIEALVNQGKGQFRLTGQMGNVMKESAAIAWSWVRRCAVSKGLLKAAWFDSHFVHLHIPEGATPKDGPSAGITMATALLSLLAKKAIKPKLAMTGELSLTGQVLAIGGLKEKTIAAHRNGIKTVIIPAANKGDLEKIPDYIKKGLQFHQVQTMDEVIALAFQDIFKEKKQKTKIETTVIAKLSSEERDAPKGDYFRDTDINKADNEFKIKS
ncbi:MAG: endopeptidase La [Treponema sp.]